MIRDARVLDPEFVPREVVHRNAELNALSNSLEPVTDGEPAETTLLFGPSGTGKTCLARHTVTQLREAVIDLNTQYVNCWQNYSRYRVLYRILEGLDRTIDIHRQSTPTDVLLERVQDYDGPPYVVILDEVDQLEDTSVLYDLYRTRGLSMLLVANREEDLAKWNELDGDWNEKLWDALYDKDCGVTEDAVKYQKLKFEEIPDKAEQIRIDIEERLDEGLLTAIWRRVRYSFPV